MSIVLIVDDDETARETLVAMVEVSSMSFSWQKMVW